MPPGWNMAFVMGREGMWRVWRCGLVCPSTYKGVSQREEYGKSVNLTVKSRNRRSALVVKSTGTWGDGWNCTTLISPSAFADRFASRSRSMESEPWARIFALRPARTEPVPESRESSALLSSASSASGSESVEDLLRFPVVSCTRLRAFVAHSGVGLIFSYCLRRRRS